VVPPLFAAILRSATFAARRDEMLSAAVERGASRDASAL